MGEDSGSGDVDDERAKFVVEKLVDEWIDYYELTKPGSYIKRFFKNSKNPTTNELSDEFKREKEGKDLSSGIYRSAWKFDEDGFVGKEESYESTCLSQPSSVKNSTSNSRGFESKCCSSCNRDFFTNAKFCEDCGKELENKISEIVPDETSGNNHPRRGGSKVIGNPLIWGSGVIISLIGLFFVR
jgi:hypothetical protein